MDILDLIAHDYPEQEVVCGPWCKKPGLILLHGQAGLGKTILLLYIALCTALGRRCMGWDVPKPRQVVLFDGEMPIAQQATRIKKIIKGLGQAPAPEMFNLINYERFPGGVLPNLSTEEGQQVYEQYIGGAEVIIIDNLLNAARAIGPRDTDFEQWARIKPWLIKLRSEGRTVILVHHTGKSGDQLGTSTKINEVDIDVALTKAKGLDVDSNGFEFTLRKKRTILDNENSSPLFISFWDDALTGGIRFESEGLKDNLAKRLKKLMEIHSNLRVCAAICGVSYEYACVLSKGSSEPQHNEKQI